MQKSIINVSSFECIIMNNPLWHSVERNREQAEKVSGGLITKSLYYQTKVEFGLFSVSKKDLQRLVIREILQPELSCRRLVCVHG